MNAWLIGLGLALLCAVHAEDPDSIDYEKAGGFWHVLGIATDCKKFLKHKDEMKVVRASLEKMEDGSFKTVSAIPLPEGCKKIEMVFKKREDGKFTHTCKWGEKVLEDVFTDYDNFGILSVTVHKEGKKNAGKEPTKMVTLLGRNLEVTPEILEKFTEKAREAGLTEEQTKIFPNEEVACTETE